MEGALEMPALGRPFQLGRLYDCRRDSLVPDVTLWDADILQSEVTEYRSQVDFQVLPSESLQSKASALNLKGSLKASFFGGLFEVGGAATYLEENQPPGSHVRGALHLSVITELKYLSTGLLHRGSVSYKEAFEEGSATHVVMAVLYGAQAFFVFDCGVSVSQDSQNIQRHLLEMIQKIPKVAAGGRDAPRWSDGEREMQGKIKCTLYSDIPPKNPTTFQEALQIYASFPQMLGERGTAVPVKVWLSPLIAFHPKAARILWDPPLGWLREAEAHLQALIKVDLRCQDLIESPVVALFPEMKDQVEQLRSLCRRHGQVFRQEVGKALLAVRAGQEEAAVLGEVLTRLLRSPFHQQALEKLLARKKREMDFVTLCLSHLKGLEVVSTPDKLEEILFDCTKKVVVAFVLTSLHREEPSLDGLRGWLGLEGSGVPATAGSSSDKPPSKLWFEDEERKQWIRCAVSSLSDFAKIHQERDKVRFLVSSVWDDSHPGASVYRYVNGKLVNSHLELPSRPAPPEIELLQPGRVSVTVNPVTGFGAGSVSRYEVEYRIAGDKWTGLPVKWWEDGVSLDVQRNVQYQFRCAAVTQVGIGQWSEISSHCPTGNPEKEALLPRVGRAESGAQSGARGHGGEVPELRVVLVGKTGAGKSATGNTILKSKCFVSEMSLQTVTRSCQREEKWLKDRKIVVVDTPGVCGTQLSQGETSTELKNCLRLCRPGPHAFIHILKIGTFTTEEKKTVQVLKRVFQASALRYVIVLFTGKEDLEGQLLESFISAQDKELKTYIAQCGNRCLAFSNRAQGKEREAQVDQLIQMVQDLVEKNQEAPYYSEDTSKGYSWMPSLFSDR